MELDHLGRVLIVAGVAIAIIGGGLLLASRVPLLGRLPGDVRIQQDGFACFFPLVTGLLLSIVLTVVLNLIFRARQ